MIYVISTFIYIGIGIFIGYYLFAHKNTIKQKNINGNNFYGS